MKKMIVLLLMLASCKSTTKSENLHSVKGGEEINHGIVVNYYPDGRLTIQDNRKASTQPSSLIATTQIAESDKPFTVGPSKEGETGSVTFTEAKKVASNPWPVAIGFVIVGLFLWFMTVNPLEKIFAVACFACAGLAFLAPLVLDAIFILAIIAAIWIVWRNSTALKQLVTGNQAALAAVDLGQATKLKAVMQQKHDKSTQRVIGSLKI